MRRTDQFVIQFGIMLGVATLMYFLLPVMQANAQAARIIPFVFVIFGAAVLVWVAVTANRYRDVIDYESTTFLGRHTNGKGVRSVVNAAGTMGCLTFIVGIVALIFILMFT